MPKHGKLFKSIISISIALILSLTLPISAMALTDDAGDGLGGKCTDFYMGKDITADGSYIWGRSEDVGGNAKRFDVKPATDFEPGTPYLSGESDFEWVYPTHTLRYIMCKDSQAVNGYATDEVYGEVGMNEKGVAISATVSFNAAKTAITSVDPTVSSTGLREADIVSLVLMQAETAREGCELLAEIIDSVGAAGRDGIMIGDPNETWYFQTLSGHQYVAVKCPDDKIGYTPNITGNVGSIGSSDMYTIIDDTDNVIASDDLISLPKAAGVLVGDDTKIKIADTYTKDPTNLWTGRMRSGYGYLHGFTTEAEIESLNPTQYKYIDYFTEPRQGSGYTLYEAMRLLGTRGEGTEWEVVNPTGNSLCPASPTTVEAHVFQTRPDMAPDMATVEWLAMGPAEFSVYLPFYGNLVTDVFEKYPGPDNEAIDYVNLDNDSMDRIFRGIYNQITKINPTDSDLSGLKAANAAPKADRERWGNGVLEFWERYQKALIEQQATADEWVKKALNEGGVPAAEELATQLSIALSEETYQYAQTILKELCEFRQANTAGEFVPSLLNDPDAIPHYAVVTLDRAEATAQVEVLKGNMNNLTITVTEFYSDGSERYVTATISIENNSAGTYEVGKYRVYVDTKGNDQIRSCYIL